MNELQIETYIEAQEAPVTKEEMDHYNNTLLDLGLDDLIIQDREIPIAPMSNLEEKVYKTLCPKSVELKKYKHPIPIRVLRAYIKCKDYLERRAKEDTATLKVEIWIDEDPDPVMIARLGWSEKFLIGRWGIELQDFPTLLRRAKDKALAESAQNIAKAKSIIELYDRDKDAFAIGKIKGDISTIYL